MTLSYREDWAEAADRLCCWWEGEWLGRPAMTLTAPRDNAIRQDIPQAPNLWEHWTNLDYVIPRTDQSIRNTAWFAEGCPQAFVNLGPVSVAGFFGTKIRAMPNTMWHDPVVEDWETYEVHFDSENEWWETHKRLARALVEAGDGKFFVATADLGDAGDAISYLRGPQQLCMDLIEGPLDKMKRVRDELLRVLLYAYDELAAIINARMSGSSSWLGVWSPKRTLTLQSDFSCMISKPMYDDFIAPAIMEQARRLDHIAYHLDGPGAIRHVETVLSIPHLHVIQWVPGAGIESAAHPKWRPLLKKIIRAGVRVHLSVAPDEIEDLLSDLPADALYLHTRCESEAEAQELLKKVQQWSRQ